MLGLADAILGVGDILMPLVASMPDEEGVRTIWAGERRWMAATRLLQLGQLPEVMLQGLPFVEREADAGEAAVIAIIENTARADLTPWEDALLLKAAADATGLNATELARRTGRARDGDRGGVRDVQVKLKVAREATDEAIAAYAANGSWDLLRDSVSRPKPRPEPEIVTTKAQRLALAELLHKAGGQAERDVAILPAAFAGEGDRLQQYRLAVLRRDVAGDTARVTPTGIDYLQAEGLSGSIENARHRLGYPEGYGVARYRTEWLNTPTTSATARDPAPETAALAGDEPVKVGEDRIAAQIATYTLPNPRRPLGVPLMRITLGRHANGTWSYATESSNEAGDGGGYGLAFVEARERSIPTQREALIAAVNELRTEAIGPRANGSDVRQRVGWLDGILSFRVGADATDAPEGPDPLVVNGVRHPNLARANEARRAAGILPRQSNGGSGARREHGSHTQPSKEAPDAVAPAPAGPGSTPAAPDETAITTPALALVRIERARQQEAEGDSAEDDVIQNSEGELAAAAAAYAASAYGDVDAALFWPASWDAEAFKPTGTIRDLVRAGALILAEIERRQRCGEA